MNATTRIMRWVVRGGVLSAAALLFGAPGDAHASSYIVAYPTGVECGPIPSTELC